MANSAGARRDGEGLGGNARSRRPRCEKRKPCVPLPSVSTSDELRAVDEEAGSQLLDALAAGRMRPDRRPRAGRREDREDRSDRDVDVDVRRAVERVDGEGQRARRGQQHRRRPLLGRVPGDRRLPHRVVRRPGRHGCPDLSGRRHRHWCFRALPGRRARTLPSRWCPAMPMAASARRRITSAISARGPSPALS